MIDYRLSFNLILVVTLTGYLSPVHAKMYRWVDQDGNVSYSDKVPPQQSKLERKVLNEKGRVVETVQAAKSEEQIELEKRLEILRKEQEKIIAKKKSNDKVLLSTFRNVDDLRFALNSKLVSVDAQKRVHEKTLENLKEDLQRALTRAAQEERSGRRVSDKLLGNIAEIEVLIVATNKNIAQVLKKRQAIESKFEKEIERFIFLTKNNKSVQQTRGDAMIDQKAADVLGLYNCMDEQTCLRAWEEAGQFVIINSTTGININSDNLVMSLDPMKETDISLSVSKSRRGQDKSSIFLDIRCHKSNLGTELCQSEKVDLIRRSFRPYIESALAK